MVNLWVFHIFLNRSKNIWNKLFCLIDHQNTYFFFFFSGEGGESEEEAEEAEDRVGAEAKESTEEVEEDNVSDPVTAKIKQMAQQQTGGAILAQR